MNRDNNTVIYIHLQIHFKDRKGRYIMLDMNNKNNLICTEIKAGDEDFIMTLVEGIDRSGVYAIIWGGVEINYDPVTKIISADAVFVGDWKNFLTWFVTVYMDESPVDAVTGEKGEPIPTWIATFTIRKLRDAIARCHPTDN